MSPSVLPPSDGAAAAAEVRRQAEEDQKFAARGRGRRVSVVAQPDAA